MFRSARILGCALICAVAFSYAAPLAPIDSFVRLSEDEGLAHADVRAIVQDHEGFIWFGLRLGGLTRYDGYEMKVHQHDPKNPNSIGNRIIWSLLVDRGGALWIGTEGGLDRYDRKTDTFIHYRHDPQRADSLPNNVVVGLCEDSRGFIWAGTRDGLTRLDDRERGTFTTFRRPEVVPGSTATDTYRSVTEDPSTGLLWVGATDGLAAFDPRTGAFASFINDPADPESLSRNAVNKVVRDRQGVFWALTEQGLNSFQPTFDHIDRHTVQQPRLAFHRYLQPADPRIPGVNFIRDGVIDRSDRMWLGTRNGLQLFDRATGKFTSYTRKPGGPSSLSDDLTQAVFEDQVGNIWVGTYSGGANLLRIGGKSFRVHRYEPGNPQSLSEDRITGLAFDSQGLLWASTVAGLNCYDGKTWKRYLHDPADPASIPANDLSSLAVGPNGNVWLGANYAGLILFDRKKFHAFPTTSTPAANGLQDATGEQVHSVLPDATGGAWLGARSYGLDYFSGGKFLHYTPQRGGEGIPPQPTTNAVFGLLQSDGTLWFATESNGLVRLDPDGKKFTTFQPPAEQAGASHNLHCIVPAGDDTLWLGAADGLFKFSVKEQRFVRSYTVAEGLPHAAVVTIVRDRRGHLWLGTANGLADFDPATEKFRAYEKPDGLPSNVFSQRAGALGPDGHVYLGTRVGIVDFAPEELHDNTNPPPVVLTEFRWLGTPPGPAGAQKASVLNIGDTIHVPPGQLGFTVKFSALDFTAPEKNRFRHRLDGWDADWRETNASERSATYTALPPGTYTFQVLASNSDLVWNERGAALRIVVEPQIWQTLWFRIATGLLTAFCVVGALQWRLKSIRGRNALLEEQVSLRTVQLQQEIAVRQNAEAALRESFSDLERRVQARTAELAQTNANLQAQIAERRTIEEQLRQSQKMEAIGQLAGGVAHDFNNLLTVILGQSELLTDGRMQAEDRAAAIRDIKAAAQRATNLTRQLLVFSRRQAMNSATIDLNKVVSGISKLLGHVIGEHITLTTNLHPTPIGVFADRGMLEQVLLNMAVNARDAMPRGGRLTITTSVTTVSSAQARRTASKPGEYARFSVHDSGSGIAQEVLPQIFEPFFTTKEAGKGTGLGLAISLGIVQQHHGWIDVESPPGSGTTFHVYLPIQPLAVEVNVAESNTPPPSPGNATILLVEDESAVRGVVQRALTRQGYRVIEAVSGADALARWTEHRDQISVLLTDIVMPGWPDGHELSARLLKEKPSLRVITMSGYDPGEVVSRTGGTRPHLRKPFTGDDLLRLLEDILRTN